MLRPELRSPEFNSHRRFAGKTSDLRVKIFALEKQLGATKLEFFGTGKCKN